MDTTEDDLDGWQRYVDDAAELVAKLEIVPAPATYSVGGSLRYRRLDEAYSALRWSQNELPGDAQNRWEDTQTSNGRTGHYLMRKISEMIDLLKSLRENQADA